jgi:hypothetical protein
VSPVNAEPGTPTFVIGGYSVGGSTFDSLIFGYYEGKNLIYAPPTRNGFTPALRADLMKRLRPLETAVCPFSNLPEAKAGRWGAGGAAGRRAGVFTLELPPGRSRAYDPTGDVALAGGTPGG